MNSQPKKIDEMLKRLFTPDLLNHFQNKTVYNRRTIQNIQEQYSHSTHPMANEIFTLLTAVSDFRSKTSHVFDELQKKVLTENDKAKTIDSINQTIENTQRNWKKIQDPAIRKILSDAIAYCKKCVEERLNTNLKKDFKSSSR